MDICVKWERVIQVKPYESERIGLEIREVVALDAERPGVDGVLVAEGAKGAAAATAEGLKIQRAMALALAKIGDELIAGRLQAHALL
jgi:hypothetical protein